MRLRFSGRVLAALAVTLASVAHVAVVLGQQAPAGDLGLRIVVIEGEDAVNIIQQKTAVAPLVEIRDRNGLPVAGVSVTFAVSGSKATFAGGLQQLTIVSNAAGRAAASGLTPLTSGSFEIGVTAVHQGQTVGATIAQSNVMTAAQAAQAAGTASGTGQSSTAAGSGAGGGGGGMSNLALIGIAGGAGAAGLATAVVVTQKDECQYSLSPGSISLPGNGGSVSVTIAASPSDCDPVPWTLSVSGGFTASPSSGAGPATVSVSAPTNNSGGSRSGSISIAGGQSVSVSQAAQCAFTVTPGFGTLGSAAGNVVVTVTASPTGCSPSSWTASSSASFVSSISPTSGSGSGVVTLSITANTQPASRSGTYTIAGQTLTITQGPGSTPCGGPATLAGSDLPVTRTYDLGRASGTFTFSYETYGQEDRLVLTHEGRTLHDSGCVGTNGTRSVSIGYSGSSSVVSVAVTPNCRGGFGTSWQFTVSCPR